jgi:hypothetical protein
MSLEAFLTISLRGEAQVTYPGDLCGIKNYSFGLTPH